MHKAEPYATCYPQISTPLEALYVLFIDSRSRSDGEVCFHPGGFQCAAAKERAGRHGNHQRQAHQGVAAHHSVCPGPGRRRDSGVAPRPSQGEAEPRNEFAAGGRAAGAERGSSTSDKIEVIQNLGKVVDRLVIGGAMAYTFLRAQGLPTGKSLVQEDKIELAKELLASLGSKLLLPVDHVVVSEIAAGAASEVVERIPDDKIAVDIGTATIPEFSRVVAV